MIFLDARSHPDRFSDDFKGETLYIELLPVIAALSYLSTALWICTHMPSRFSIMLQLDDGMIVPFILIVAKSVLDSSPSFDIDGAIKPTSMPVHERQLQ